MAQQKVDSKAGELGAVNSQAGLLSHDKQIPVSVKKTPLRDLQSENNIVPPKVSGNPPPLKELVVTEAAKVSGTKRSSSESPMSPSQPHSAGGNCGNGHLVYVRRKSEIEAGKNNNNEVVADNTISPRSRQLSHQEEECQSDSLIKESQMQWLPAYAPFPATSQGGTPSGKPSILPLGYLNRSPCSEEPCNQPAPSGTTLSAQPKVHKQHWEERYLQLQMFLKKLDESNLEDQLQMLRSLSAVELSRHAVELEKRAIQLSLEQGKEMLRVKALNVVGKPVRTADGPSAAQQQVPRN